MDAIYRKTACSYGLKHLHIENVFSEYDSIREFDQAQILPENRLKIN